MNDVNKKIENARFNFQKIMDKMPSIKSKDFIAKAANLKQQLNSIKDIPNLKTIKNLHQKYCEEYIF